MALYKDIKDEYIYIYVYILRKKHNLSLSVNNYKHSDVGENNECLADSLKSD